MGTEYNGEYESMLQRVYRQIKTVTPNANIIIAIFMTLKIFLKVKLSLYVLLILMLKIIISGLLKTCTKLLRTAQIILS